MKPGCVDVEEGRGAKRGGGAAGGGGQEEKDSETTCSVDVVLNKMIKGEGFSSSPRAAFRSVSLRYDHRKYEV